MKDQVNLKIIVDGAINHLLIKGRELPKIHKDYLWELVSNYHNPHEARQFEFRTERLNKMGYDVRNFVHVYEKSIHKNRISYDSDRDDIRIFRRETVDSDRDDIRMYREDKI